MPKENQRVALTKRLLKDSLMELLQKRRIDRISVKELCERAGLNRTTFYRYYQTPHDILWEIEYDFARNFRELPEPPEAGYDVKKHADHMCRFLLENKELVKLFMRNGAYDDGEQIFQHLAEDSFTFRTVIYKGRPVDENTWRLMSVFFSHGVYALVRSWLLEDIPLTPEEVAGLIAGFFGQDFRFQR